MLQFVQTVNSYLADYILIILLIGTGIYFTMRTRFVQIRCFGEGMKKVFGNFSLHGGKQHGGISSFQALTTAIAAQVGTGNIVGACGAILTGGPGAIFWMWIIAFLGMSTIYAEAVLAQKTREVDADGNVTGGPVYYIHKAFPNGFGRSLAGFFSVAIIIALGFMGCMVQSNSIAESCTNAFGIPGWAVGVIIAAVAALIFIGGVQRIAFVTEKLVPLMACLYLLGGLIILIARIQYLPAAIGMIFKYAFVPQAIIGGGVGAALKIAISQGAKRGLFSNEAGMGSTPHAHAIAKVEKPHDQGVVAMIGVFIDTFIVLTMVLGLSLSDSYALFIILCAASSRRTKSSTILSVIWLLSSIPDPLNLSICLFLAQSTSSCISLVDIPSFFSRSLYATPLSSRCISILSIIGPDIFCLYLAISPGVHVHS